MAMVTGKAAIKYNGKLLESKDGAKMNMGGAVRKAVKGDTGVHGYQEETAVPFVECKISHKADTDVAELKNITDATIVVEADSGKSYVMRGAWTVNPVEIDFTPGEIPLRFEGLSAEES